MYMMTRKTLQPILQYHKLMTDFAIYGKNNLLEK